MSTTLRTESAAATPTVTELLEQRAQVLGWLERLEALRGEEEERVFERVRSDYQARLENVVQQLAVHLESLYADLSEARQRERQAEQSYQVAAEQRAETRLRHRIGEIPDAEWEARRAELDAAVVQAEEERRAAHDEAAHLQEVVALAEAAGEDVAPVNPVDLSRYTEPAEDDGESDEFAFFQVSDVELDPAEDGEDDGLEFLAELDRAISSTPDSVDAEEEDADEESSAGAVDPQTRPSPGVKCGECGYTNDRDALYCGVCGIQLP